MQNFCLQLIEKMQIHQLSAAKISRFTVKIFWNLIFSCLKLQNASKHIQTTQTINILSFFHLLLDYVCLFMPIFVYCELKVLEFPRFEKMLIFGIFVKRLRSVT
jgi:hypothetical protein